MHSRGTRGKADLRASRTAKISRSCCYMAEDSSQTDMACRNKAAKDGFPGVEGGAKTLYEVFEYSAKKHGNKNCLGWRSMSNGKPGPYEFWTYNETRGADLLSSSQFPDSKRRYLYKTRDCIFLSCSCCGPVMSSLYYADLHMHMQSRKRSSGACCAAALNTVTCVCREGCTAGLSHQGRRN